MPAKSFNYMEFLFTETGELKTRVAPVVNYIQDTDSFILKYSIPGYHMPRQYFKFSTIPDSFPNPYVSEVFRIFSITNSFLFRHPHNRIPEVKKNLVREYFCLNEPEQLFSQDEIEAAQYNLELAIKLGRSQHSLFYFDSYLEAYKVLHPEIRRYSKNVVKKIQTQFNKLIS